MNKQELQKIKLDWLFAEEHGDTARQTDLICTLSDYPDAQSDLIDFIAAYRASDIPGPDASYEYLVPMAFRAMDTAMKRVFGESASMVQATNVLPAMALLSAQTLSELRMQRGFSKTTAARGLRLSIDVWNKFEEGAIDLISLTRSQLDRLSTFFEVSIEQFSHLLSNSQPTPMLNRRQTGRAARSTHQGPRKQSLAEAIERSTMTHDEKNLWLEH